MTMIVVLSGMGFVFRFYVALSRSEIATCIMHNARMVQYAPL